MQSVQPQGAEVLKCCGAAAKYVNRQNGEQRCVLAISAIIYPLSSLFVPWFAIRKINSTKNWTRTILVGSNVVLAGIGTQIWTLKPRMNLTPASRSTPPQAFTWRKVTPAGWDPLSQLTGQSASVGYPTPHANTVKEKGEIIWKGSGPHLAVVPHLPGVPHLHVNRP